MDPTRPLREVFDELAAGRAHREPAEVMREAGHADLPADLLDEAIVNYADTAPVDVAEQLQPFVTWHTGAAPGAESNAPEGLELLAGTAAPSGELDAAELDSAELDSALAPTADVPALDLPFGAGSDGLDFGSGGTGAVRLGGEDADSAGFDATSEPEDAGFDATTDTGQHADAGYFTAPVVDDFDELSSPDDPTDPSDT